MRQNYNLDVGNDSKWVLTKPNPQAEDLLLNVSEVGHFYAGKNFFMDRDGRKEYYILYTVSGCGVLRHKGQKVIVSKRDAVLIYCEEHQFYGTISDETWEHYWVHFSGPSADSFFRLIAENGIGCIHIEDTDAFEENMEGMLRHAGTLDVSQTIMNAMFATNLLTIMTMARHDVRSPRVLTDHEGTLNEVIEYIKENYAKSVTLKDLVDVSSMSTSYLTKLFRQYTGMTPHEYLINYRVEQAKKALRRTGDPVAQVATSVGFQDVCNFTRTFRRITGTTPRNYRRADG